MGLNSVYSSISKVVMEAPASLIWDWLTFDCTMIEARQQNAASQHCGEHRPRLRVVHKRDRNKSNPEPAECADRSEHNQRSL